MHPTHLVRLGGEDGKVKKERKKERKRKEKKSSPQSKRYKRFPPPIAHFVTFFLCASEIETSSLFDEVEDERGSGFLFESPDSLHQ